MDGFGIIIRHDFQHADFLQFPIWLKYDIKHSTKNSTKTASLTEFYNSRNGVIFTVGKIILPIIDQKQTDKNIPTFLSKTQGL